MSKSTRTSRLKLRLSRSAAMSLIFVLAFGVVGTILILTSSAATSAVQLKVAFDQGLCMDNLSNSTATKNPIVIWGCNSSDTAQQWTIESVSGGFMLKDSAGTCADDTGDGVGTSSSNRVYLQTYACNSADHAQVWIWDGTNPGQIQNAYNNGCINDPGSATSNGTQLIIYPCSPVSNNAQWNQVAVGGPPPNPSVTITSPGNGATVSGSVLVAAKATISSGTITNITLKIDGATLGSCTNASSCFVSWKSTSVGNGNHTVQATATGSAGGSGSASILVAVNNGSATPPPPSGGGGSSGGGGGGDSGGGGGSGSDLSISGSGSSDSISIGSDGSTDNSSSGLTFDQTPTDTLNSGPTETTTTTTGPTVYDIVSTNITSGSISLAWQAADATSFAVKYGTNQSHLSGTANISSSASEPTLIITKLPSNTRIYISITPRGGGITGATVTTSFTTLKASNPTGAIILWLVFIAVAVLGFIFVRRRLTGGRSMNFTTASHPPTVEIEHLPTYPREDSATQAARLNWWLPDGQQQTGLPQQPHNPADDIPDMYEEGRKRLEQEEQGQQNHNGQYPGPGQQ